MRDDHKLALKKVKQQILAFCLRHEYVYTATKNHWTSAHLEWLRKLKPEELYGEILSEYLLTYQTLAEKLERLDRRIEELAKFNNYRIFKSINTNHSINQFFSHYYYLSFSIYIIPYLA